jgi:hypothetical protein
MRDLKIRTRLLLGLGALTVLITLLLGFPPLIVDHAHRARTAPSLSPG